MLMGQKLREAFSSTFSYLIHCFFFFVPHLILSTVLCVGGVGVVSLSRRLGN